jgi:hypothetical protein
MVRNERTVTRIGLTLHELHVPGDMLVRVHNDGSEHADAIVIARDNCVAMAGMMLRLPCEVSEWVPSSAWVIAYRVA